MKEKIMKNKKMIILFIALTLIISSIVYINNFNPKLKENIRVSLVNFKANVVPNDNVKVKTVDIGIIDGTGPFNTTEEPGKDMSDNNKIVRSVDSVVYTVTPYIEGRIDDSITDSTIIVVEGKLPKKPLVFWDEIAIKNWAGSDNVTFEDKGDHYYMVFRKKYSELLSENSNSTFNLPFTVEVDKAENGTEIKPEFKVYIEGNSEAVKVTEVAEKVLVSAKDDYYNYFREVKFKEIMNQDSKQGRKLFVSKVIDNPSLILEKGTVELNGNINSVVDLEVKLQPLEEGHGGKIKTITDLITPKLIGATLVNKKGSLKNNTVNIVERPDSNTTADFNLSYDLYNNINREDLYNQYKIRTRVTETELEFFVPFLDDEYVKNWAKENNIPVDKNGMPSYRIIVEVKDKDVEYTKRTNKEVINIRDTHIGTAEMEKLKEGNVGSTILYKDKNSLLYDLSKYGVYEGTSSVQVGRKNLILSVSDTYREENDAETRPVGVTTIVKIDANNIEIIKNSVASTEEKTYSYAVKKDGTNWISDEEMYTTRYDNLDFYPTIEEAKKHGKIVGYAVQQISKGTGFSSRYFGADHDIVVKDDAKINYVTPAVKDVYMFKNSSTRTTNVQKYGGSLLDKTFKAPENNDGFKFELSSYRKTEYNEDFSSKVTGSHDSNTLADSLLILQAKPSIDIEVQKETEGTAAQYDIGKGEDTAIFKLTPKVGISTTKLNDKVEKITITAILPKGLNYKGGDKIGGTYDSITNTVTGGEDIFPTSIIKNENGTTTVKYSIFTKLNEEEIAKKHIFMNTDIPIETPHGKNLVVDTNIEISNILMLPLNEREDSTSISIINLLAQLTTKDLKQQVIENGEKFEFSLRYLNQGRSELENLKLLDILPYNNDNRGSNFTGTYKINNIRVVTTKNELPVTDNSRIYYTTSTNIRTKEANNFLQDSSINWIEYTGGEISNVTAIYTKGNLGPESKREVTFELIPQNSTTGSIYANKLYTHVDNQADTLNTPIYKGIIAKRTISGKVFKDVNLNGIREASEQLLSGKIITLLTENGQRVQRVNGTFVDPVTTNSNGEYTFEDVPALTNMKIKVDYNNSTEEITKVIADNKANLDGYITGISMIDAKKLIEANALEVKRNQDFGITPKISITANKIWVGGPTTNRPSIQLQLKKDGVNLGAPVTVTTVNGQTTTSYTWNNLDITNNTGKYYEYTVDEVNVPQNYAKSLSANKLTITNTYTVPQISFTGTKKFVGGENSRPGFVELKILRNGQEIPGLENNGIKRISVNSRENIYTAVWNNLDRTDSNGVEYNYTVEEINVPTNYRKTFENNNKTVVNTYVSPTQRFILNHNWVNGEVVRDNVRVQLYQNGQPYKEVVVLGKTNQSTTFNDIPKTDSNGNAYTYTANIVNTITNFTKTIGNVSVDNNTNTLTQTITNTYNPPRVNVQATKNWVGGEDVRPDSIKLQLYKNNQVEGEIFNLPKTQTVKVWENLPGTDLQGNKFTYTVDEVEVVDNFVKKVVNTATGTIITNTFESPKTDVTVTKNWINGENKIVDVKFQLKQNGQNYKDPITITKDSLSNNVGTYTFTNLDKMDSRGNNYTYTVVELTTVENFEKREEGLNVVNEYKIPKIDINVTNKYVNWYKNKENPKVGIQLYRDGNPLGDIVTTNESSYIFKQLDKTDITGREYNYEVKEVIVPKYFEKTETKISNTEHELVNTYIPPVMEVYVNKVWVNGNQENRPEIEFVLYGNTSAVASAKLENGQTSYIFKDIPKFDNEGEEIAYMIKEKINEKEYIAKNNIKYDFKYDSSIEKIEVEDDLKQVFEATNEYIIPKTKFNVRKLWVGDNKENRPSIQIQLYQNGMKYKEPITLTKDETEYTWEDLDATNKYQEEYVYTADEVNVPNGYDKKVLENGAKIINIKKTVNGYLPFAGLKENTQIGIVLILIASIVYLRNSKKNYIVANKRTKLSNMNIRRKK